MLHTPIVTSNKEIYMSNATVREAELRGKEAFFEGDDVPWLPENPYEWGTPEFKAFYSAYTLEYSAWEWSIREQIEAQEEDSQSDDYLNDLTSIRRDSDE